MLIVQKYGGTSLAGMSRLRAAARRVTGLARQGNQVVVVVSAQGDTTDMLIEKAAQVNRRGSAREMDAYLAAGEQMSAGLMTMAIGAMGYSAVSLTGWQAGIRTDGVHGNARILDIDVSRIRRELVRPGGRPTGVRFSRMQTASTNGTPEFTPTPPASGASATGK